MTRENVIIELHRLFFLEKIPVYVSSANKIFVGFSSLSQKQVLRIKNKLTDRLLTIAKKEEHIDNNLQLLNPLNQAVGTKPE